MPHLLAPEGDRSEQLSQAPAISVVIAAFEAAATIGATIRSVIAQSPSPLEIVVCDDGSSDDLAGALSEFGEKVRLLRIEHGGEAKAKNAAIEAASGEFVAIIDADDRFLPGRLAAIQRVLIERADLDLVTTDAVIELNGRVVGRAYNNGNIFAVESQRAAILDHNFIFGQVVVKREVMLRLGGFDPEIKYTTDWECWIRLILDGGRVGCIDAPLGVYVMHESSMSASRQAMYEGRVATLRKTLRDSRLSEIERGLINERISAEERRTSRAEMRSALITGDELVRQIAQDVAKDATQPRRERLKAAFAAFFPRIASARMRSHNRSYWIGVGDQRFQRSSK
ncbi:Glycosyl transferase family 2 [Actinobacteria bacterium IMCC26256]|nr:Glycosyl transferase family 2 [Actinobacteria bacterium IMCC26256]